MGNSESSHPKPERAFAVNMSSEAIASRLREVGELNQLGKSLSKAKPCPPPYQYATSNATDHPVRTDLEKKR